MKFANPYWSNKIKISFLQRWVIVQSIIYYELNSSVVSDEEFDGNAKQLVQMQKDFPDEAKQSDYWYVFNDFDGTTGFDLFYRLKKKNKQYLTQIAHHVIKLYKKEGAK